MTPTTLMRGLAIMTVAGILAACEPIAMKADIEWDVEEFLSPKTLSWSFKNPDPMSTFSLYAPTMSDDGSTILLGTGSGGVYVSRDSGATWISRSLSVGDIVQATGISSDGEIMLVGRKDGSLYRSVDGGLTWAPLATTPSTAAWTAVAVSSDGQIMAAPSGYDSILVSENGGDSWIARPTPMSSSPKFVALSDDGSTLVAVGSYRAYISGDQGRSWVETLSANSQYIRCFGLSGDGKTIAVSADAKTFLLSRDRGDHWMTGTSPGSANYLTSIAISTFGTRLVACEFYVTSSNTAHVSYDAGASWSAFPGLSVAMVNGAAASSNATGVVVIDRASGVHIGR